MIFIDDYPGSYKGMTAHHLISDIPGPGGEKELLEFGERIGLKPKWIQKPGTPFVHFDCMAGKIEKAKNAGATEVTTREGVKIIKGKAGRR